MCSNKKKVRDREKYISFYITLWEKHLIGFFFYLTEKEKEQE